MSRSLSLILVLGLSGLPFAGAQQADGGPLGEIEVEVDGTRRTFAVKDVLPAFSFDFTDTATEHQLSEVVARSNRSLGKYKDVNAALVDYYGRGFHNLRDAAREAEKMGSEESEFADSLAQWKNQMATDHRESREKLIAVTAELETSSDNLFGTLRQQILATTDHYTVILGATAYLTAAEPPEPDIEGLMSSLREIRRRTEISGVDALAPDELEALYAVWEKAQPIVTDVFPDAVREHWEDYPELKSQLSDFRREYPQFVEGNSDTLAAEFDADYRQFKTAYGKINSTIETNYADTTAIELEGILAEFTGLYEKANRRLTNWYAGANMLHLENLQKMEASVSPAMSGEYERLLGLSGDFDRALSVRNTGFGLKALAPEMFGLWEEMVGFNGAGKAEDSSYAVVPDDTLWKIAEIRLGNRFRWPELFEANREKLITFGPHLIFPGDILEIPNPPPSPPLPDDAAESEGDRFEIAESSIFTVSYEEEYDSIEDADSIRGDLMGPLRDFHVQPFVLGTGGIYKIYAGEFYTEASAEFLRDELNSGLGLVENPEGKGSPTGTNGGTLPFKIVKSRTYNVLLDKEFKSLADAEHFKQRMMGSDGFSYEEPYITATGGAFLIQMGSFSDRVNSENMQAALNGHPFPDTSLVAAQSTPESSAESGSPNVVSGRFIVSRSPLYRVLLKENFASVGEAKAAAAGIWSSSEPLADDPYIIEADGAYRLQVGAFLSKENAENKLTEKNSPRPEDMPENTPKSD